MLIHRSKQAEKEHLIGRRFSRELVIRIGYRRFWQHQTRAELHEWLTQEMHLSISEREIGYLVLDFLALLSGAQSRKVRQKLSQLKGLIIGLDGMQPEKGNDCLYIVRELQSSVTLRAETLEESSHDTLSQHLLEPLKGLAAELGLPWIGVVSDAQESIRLAIAQSLSGVPHQVCQVHCLCDAGKLTFDADRAMKKTLKSAIRNYLGRLRKSIQALVEDDCFRSILMDYANVLRATLWQAGVAPFELGGVQIFEDLESLEASLLRCQKKQTIGCFNAC
jgi:hypothetical protein